MKLSITNFAFVVVVAAATVAPNGASASLAEHTTEQRELWGSGWYKWTPKEPEECYDVRKSFLLCFSRLFSVAMNLSSSISSHLLFFSYNAMQSTV